MHTTEPIQSIESKGGSGTNLESAFLASPIKVSGTPSAPALEFASGMVWDHSAIVVIMPITMMKNHAEIIHVAVSIVFALTHRRIHPDMPVAYRTV